MSVDLNKLAATLQELDDQMVACMKCGMCQAVCPVFAETFNESDVTRGKIALLENLAHEMVQDPKAVQDKVNRCLLCGSCAANCPSGVQIMDIFIRARAIVVSYMGLSPVKKIIFRGMLTKPKLFNALIALSSTFQGIFTSKANDFMGSSCSKIMSPLIGDRHFMPLAKKSLMQLHGPIDEKPDPKKGEAGPKVAFFPGCVVDKMYTSVGESVLKILRHHNCGIIMPEGQACCGIPALSSGDRQSYDKLVDLNLSVFASLEFDVLITPCATCTSTIKEMWPHFAEEYSPEKRAIIKEIAEKSMDISQFLVDKLGVEATPADATGSDTGKTQRITYHDPCHLAKSLSVSAQPRTILQTNPDYEYVEMNEANRCCGNGGSFNLLHYDISKKIGQRKRDNIVASQAQVVTTSCPACMMQMTDLLSQNKDAVAVRHVAEIYADSLEA